MKTGMVPLSMAPGNPHAKFLLPVPVTASSAGLGGSVPEVGGIFRRHDNNSTGLEAKTSYRPLGVPQASESTKQELQNWWVTDQTTKRKKGPLLPRGGEEEYVWGTGSPLGHLSMPLHPVIRVRGSYNNPSRQDDK